MNTARLAQVHSAACFLNSFLREWKNVSLVETPAALGVEEGRSFLLELPTGKLFLPLKKISAVGRHEYGEIFFLEKSGDFQRLDFLGMANFLTAALAQDFGTSEAELRTFQSRIQNSVENIAKALHARETDLKKLYSEELEFLGTEQGLLIGHSFHPTPKSRDEFSDSDLARYSPEMKGAFPLRWFLVKPELVEEQRSRSYKEIDWSRELFALETNGDSKGFVPFPVHPWQRKKLLEREDIRAYIESGKILDTVVGGEVWHPTSSLRSLYREGAPYMLKFSLSVRLTNSIRHLQPVEVERGMQVHDVLTSSEGKKFLAEYPNFHPIYEPAFMALKDKNGAMIVESIVVCRENPFRSSSEKNKAVLATLAQENPLGGENLLQGLVRQAANGASLHEATHAWFKSFVDLAVEPLFAAQSRYGILIGAHQQNLVFDIAGGTLNAVYFRDCQGTGYSRRGFELFGPEVSRLSEANGNVLDEEMGNSLFAYYVIVNSAFNVIAALAKSDWAREEELLAVLRGRLESWLAAGPADPSCLAYVLGKSLNQKGNFLCCFRNINENTTANPLAIYNTFANPLEAAHE